MSTQAAPAERGRGQVSARGGTIAASRISTHDVKCSAQVLVQDTSLPDDFVVHIAGAGTQPDWLKAITKAGRFEVVNHGFLASLAPLYASCRVALAPLKLDSVLTLWAAAWHFVDSHFPQNQLAVRAR